MLDQTTSPVFRPATVQDVPRLLELAEQFFNESEFPEFTEFAPDHIRAVFEELENKPTLSHVVFAPEGEIEGFIMFTMDMTYTKDPIALLFLFYVSPEYRKSPAGRCLTRVALAEAKSHGCKAFYAGGMSGVPGSKKTIGNMFRKLGFEDVDFWGRKIL